MTTEQALAEISDAAAFERLATAVLREAAPSLYGNLTHPGINAEGKTVKSPLDGIAFVPNACQRHLVAVHHTTSQESGLRRKWLRGSAFVAGSANGSEAGDVGDLEKTLRIVQDERAHCPALRATLALTTNREPAEVLTREVVRVGSENGVEVDIWGRSRIAHFLDSDARGNWLRKLHLGISAELLSAELLTEISKKCLAAHAPLASRRDWVGRSDAQQILESAPQPIAFVAGDSGVGKSLACFWHLEQHVCRGGFALVIEHSVLDQSSSLEQAIETSLQRIAPSLAHGAGAQAMRLVSAQQSLLLTIEDISRSGRAALLIEKLCRWSELSRTAAGKGRTWQILCPVWPKVFDGLSDSVRKSAERMQATLAVFNREDARRAVQARASSSLPALSDLEADAIAEQLGYDPLLIGLWEVGSEVPASDVLAEFVRNSCRRLSSCDGALAPDDYLLAYRWLARHLLVGRELSPAWEDIRSLPAERDEMLALRQIIKQSEVISLLDTGGPSRLCFRHDRVRNWLLADAVDEGLASGKIEVGVLQDPFFADVIGEAISRGGMAPQTIREIQHNNPLALFAALRVLRDPESSTGRDVVQAIESWLAQVHTHSRSFKSLRHHALYALSETQSPRIPALIARFGDRGWAKLKAALRNGDLPSGVSLCRALEPGSGFVWRDRTIAHAMARFGNGMRREIQRLLQNPTELKDGDLSGVLRFAGHTGSDALAESLKVCWESDGNRAALLDDYLWAAAQCGGSRAAELLDPICDAWAALPSEPSEEGRSSERNSLAAHHVAWAFWRRLPDSALRVFLRRAEDEDLRWPITYMLHGLDDADCMSFLVMESARIARDSAPRGGFSQVSSLISQHWERMERERDDRMSEATRRRLLDIWADPVNDQFLLREAFTVWSAVFRPGDIAILRTLQHIPALCDPIARARLRRGDETAVPLLAERLRQPQKDYWWLQSARGIASQAMIELIDELFQHRRDTCGSAASGQDDMDWMLSDALNYLGAEHSVPLLREHWDHVRNSPHFIQSALYTADPALLQDVAQVVAGSQEPNKLFEYVHMRFGVKHIGHPGVTRLDQLAGLVPYMQLLDDLCIYSFWGLCNERGWLDFRRQHLDPHLGQKRREAECLDDAAVFFHLDGELGREGEVWLDLWAKDLIESGRTAQNILSLAGSWLARSPSLRALEIVSSLVVSIGQRGDVKILEVEGLPASANEIIEDVRYAVRRRSLA